MIAVAEAREVLVTSRGDEVPVLRTDVAAAVLLRERCRPGTFGHDLAVKYERWGWTAKQRPWAHKLANERAGDTERQVRTVEIDGDLTGLVEMMRDARENLRWPKLHLTFEVDGLLRPLVVSIAGERARHPGSLNITDGGGFHDNVWYGRVHTDGRFEPGREGREAWVREALERLAGDPAGVAREYGHRSGRCCFCNRELTAEPSLDAGYGPVCADNFGLPWG